MNHLSKCPWPMYDPLTLAKNENGPVLGLGRHFAMYIRERLCHSVKTFARACQSNNEKSAASIKKSLTSLFFHKKKRPKIVHFLVNYYVQSTVMFKKIWLLPLKFLDLFYKFFSSSLLCNACFILEKYNLLYFKTELTQTNLILSLL